MPRCRRSVNDSGNNCTGRCVSDVKTVGAGTVETMGAGAGAVETMGAGAGDVEIRGAGAGAVETIGAGAGDVEIMGAGAGNGEMRVGFLLRGHLCLFLRLVCRVRAA